MQILKVNPKLSAYLLFLLKLPFCYITNFHIGYYFPTFFDNRLVGFEYILELVVDIVILNIILF